MKTFRKVADLITYFEFIDQNKGCFADTGFLYALAYEDDRFFDKANEIFDFLSTQNIPIFVNVISRMEFVDLILRKQITNGAIHFFEKMSPKTNQRELYNLLKNIRDNCTVYKRKKLSYKIDEKRLKNLRHLFESFEGLFGWRVFCQKYSGQFLTNEWKLLEEEFGLNFIEIMEGQTSDIISHPVSWTDMVFLMGEYGIRGPDAMIANLFLKSELELLITTDSDFELLFKRSELVQSNKTVLIL